MGDRGTHTAGVSTGYPRAPGPATPGSDDPPPYSACVPNPPPFASNLSDKHPSLPAYTPEAHQPNGVPYHEAQAGNYVHDPRSSAPFLDLSSASENRPGVHNPSVSPYNTPPQFNPSFTPSQSNPSVHRHPPKTIVLQTGSGRRRKSVGLCTKIIVCVTLPIIILACIIRFTQRVRHTHHSYDSSRYGRDGVNTYHETKINPIYTDPYNNNFDVHENYFPDIDRETLQKLNEHLNVDKTMKEIFDTSQKTNVQKVDNVDPKIWINVDEMMRETLRKFGPNKTDDDYYRNTDINRLIDDTVREITFGSRRKTTDKSTTETSLREETTGTPKVDDDS